MIRLVVAACLIAAFLPAPATAQAPFPVEVRRVVLPNGLELVLAPDPAATAVDVAVWYPSGTRYEKAGGVGISHLFEHLMFRGSQGYGPQQHLKLVLAEGGTFGAYTAADYTSFNQTLPPESLELAFKLEADRMTRLDITQAALDAERVAVREERPRRFESGAIGRGLQRLYATAFGDHPYHWPVLGYDRDLERLTPALAKAWYAEHFGPGRAVVTVVGRFDPAEAEALARRTFGPLAGGKAAAAPAARLTPQTAERRAVELAESPVPVVLVGWRGPGRSDPDATLFPLLTAAIGRGDGSRLQKGLVRAGKGVLSVQADADARRDASLLYAVAAVDPSADTTEVERALVTEVERLAAEPLAADELARVKALTENGLLFSWQGSRGRAQALGTARLLAGDAQEAGRQLDRVRAATAADVQRVAAKLLTASHRSVVWLRPASPPGGGGPTGGRP